MESLLSANFEFLRPHDEKLHRLGLMAERYMSPDSASAAVKLRVFAEQIVVNVGAGLGIDGRTSMTVAQVTDHPHFRAFVPGAVQQGLRLIRRHGNPAAHEHDPIPAEHRIPLLRAAFDLGRWFVAERYHDESVTGLKFRDVEEFLAQRSSGSSSGVQRSGTAGPFTCPIPGCGFEFATGRLGWDAHIASPNVHEDWQPEIDDPKRRKEVFRQAFPEFFTGSRSHHRRSRHQEGAAPTGRACPIPGCDKVFRIGRGGWDAHVASMRNHPDWHAEVEDPEDRKERFRAEFAEWFR
jgi:hypothetical protein